ncbi:hypothetical protein [Bradyrhizobium sp. CB3481]|uniref:hypothetical protein n=1 Tax=Bradyrhizobium sp. CB3481 TaxID=3039158 RepID=UPI0024B17915|nr:hypothetical protein [Bradyrhizobium sp. CB3481]WFU15875.1 hypothetical protein QA643_33735 [Bradyrhizobium sp. CB3481]
MTCGMIARTAVALAVLTIWNQSSSADPLRNFSGNCLLMGNLSIPDDRACMSVATDVPVGQSDFCFRSAAAAARPVLEIALSRIRSSSRQICPRAGSVAAQRVQQVLR